MRFAVRWARGRLLHGNLILGYHRIADTSRDPYALCVSPQHFAEHLAILQRYTSPIRLKHLVENLHGGDLPRHAVALTFDDGYADILAQAKPLLEQYRIPATVFISTGYLGREFWWDELEHVLSSPAVLPPHLQWSVNGVSFEWTCNDATSRQAQKRGTSPREYLRELLYQQLLALSAVDRPMVMRQLWAWSGAPQRARAPHWVLTSDEIRRLADGNCIEVGAHTITHPCLAAIPAAEQRHEIQQSKTYLERLIGNAVCGFSYPNGSSSAETRAIVRQSGFSYACSSTKDFAWRGSDRFHLPRFWIPNWDGKTFERVIRRWLGC